MCRTLTWLVLLAVVAGLGAGMPPAGASAPGAASPQAIAATHLFVEETRKAASATTPVFRIPANHIALMWVAIDSWDLVGEPTGLADSSRRWTKLESRNAIKKGLTLWQSLEPVETNSPVTINHSGATRVNYVANYYTAATVRQVAAGVFSQESTTGAVTFSGPGSGGAVAAGFIRSATDRPPIQATPGPGFVFVGGEAIGVEVITRSEFSPQYQPTATMSWTAPSGWIGIAVELGGPVPGGAATTAPTAMATPTSTPRPTNTPRPTSTPMPTPTSLPVASPTSLPTPSPTAVTPAPTPPPATAVPEPTPPTDPLTGPEPGPQGGFSPWDIAGIVGVAAVLGAAAVAGGVALWRRRGG